MPISSSGAIDLQEIATEFGGSTPHSINEYYGVDHFNGVPSSGEITFDDFRGSSVRTARVQVRPDTTPAAERYGYQATNGGDFVYPECPNDDWYASFGSITNSTPSISNTITGLTMTNYDTIGPPNFYSARISGLAPIILMLSVQNNTDSGWTTLKIKATDGSSGGLGTITKSFTRTGRSSWDLHDRLQEDRSVNRYRWTWANFSPQSGGAGLSGTLYDLWQAWQYQGLNNGHVDIQFS